MTDANTQENKVQAAAPVAPSRSNDRRSMGNGPRPHGGRGGDGRRRERQGEPRERVKPEFDQKLIDIRRVTRVSSGGRRFSFSVAAIVGNKKGQVGVGIGKANDTSLAIDKAVRDAKKNIITVKQVRGQSIAHETSAKVSSARLIIRPAPGKGLIAGSSARGVLELAGVKDVNAKILSGSKNKLNIARATIKALSILRDARKAN